MSKNFFKIMLTVSLSILLVSHNGFAKIVSRPTAETVVQPTGAPTPPPTKAVQPTKTVPQVSVETGLAGARTTEATLQGIKTSIGSRSAGRAALQREKTQQAERDGIKAESLQEIIAAPDNKPNRFTQTEAYLFLPSVRELIAKNYEVEPYLDIISEAIVNETQHRNTHYVFYNTTSNTWRLAQDLDTRLFARFNPGKEDEKFTFLRFDDEYVNKTAQGFLVNELKEKGLLNDNKDVGLIILSVNFAILGNTGNPPESSWDYFIKPRSHRRPERSTYEKMMAKYGLTDKYIDELISLVDIYNTKEDTIMQIFIPKNKVDKIGYLAWRRGIPAHQATLDAIAKNAKKKGINIKISTDEMEKKFAKQKGSNPLYVSMMEGIVKGDYSLDDFLKVYCNKPWDINNINDAQGRLLFTPDVLGNPQSGVIIHRLSTVSHDKLKEYNDRLNAIIDKMVAEKERQEDAQAKG
jgi:hypothetical protein